MSRVLLPEGTAPSAHIPGIDIAGKTGSAQIVSLATRARFKNAEDLAQNGWFVGFTPRRNPDVIVSAFVRRRGARQTGRAHRDAGDQGLCRQAAPPAQQDGGERRRRTTARSTSALCGRRPAKMATNCRGAIRGRSAEETAGGSATAAPGMVPVPGRSQ
jgi:membrane peptidoglycan carboxypeptidase